mmetsp:Transcript_6154/g.14957  ORF Transcript_6154/g.14957 Transcript_6154/m.14957 type:complete len:81 (+) Transcript_6154:92-334(+)
MLEDDARTGAYRPLGGRLYGIVGGLCPGPGRPQKSSLKEASSTSILSMPNEGRRLWQVQDRARLPVRQQASPGGFDAFSL